MTLESFLDYWSSVRQRTRRLLPLVPEDRWEWGPGDGRWTIGDIVRHLGGIERWMYAETVVGRPTAYPGHGRDIAEGGAAIIAWHDRSHAEAMEIFRTLTREQWEGKAVTPAGTPITTWKWLRAMIEHEAHHRGQLYLLLGLCGVATPPIYGLTEEEVLARSVRLPS